MPATLTRLNIAQAGLKDCHGEINKQVFDTNSESVFVHLHMLSVQVCCNKSSLYTFQSFVPERFPVLRSLYMNVPKQGCNGDADIPLATIFSNKQWPTVTDLQLAGYGTRAPDYCRLLLRAMPALKGCSFRNMTDI
ncbi:hypothetical protein GQ42DRAFT_164786, partial [Ramicandelaber brevisporus]